MSLRHIFGRLRRNWDDIGFWRQNLIQRAVGPMQKRIKSSQGVEFMQEDWDNLLILDACRFDLFESVADAEGIDGRLESRISLGSGSKEFLRMNFENQMYHDTIYITANPFADFLIDDSVFFKTDHVWRDGWDDDKETVLAETMVERTRSIHKQHPNKRMVVHFIQPHVPFIADSQFENTGFELVRSKAMDGNENKDNTVTDVWDRLETGEVSKEQVWTAYRKNLEYVLVHALELAESVDGKTVLTSDHGNAFGEYAWPFPIRVYGHPINLRLESLIKVPWFILPVETRRDIRSDDPDIESTEFNDDVIEERLGNLGYVK